MSSEDLVITVYILTIRSCRLA